MTEATTVKPLAEGFWTSSAVGDLTEVLQRAAGTELEWQGIAYTTAGAKLVFGVTGSALTTKLYGEEQEIPLGTVYELRLWVVGTLPDGVVARELRWVNGVRSAEITVAVTEHAQVAAPKMQPCWCRKNSYLQHSDESDANKAPRMSSVEVFIHEKDYGNVVFADELMTGRWS